MATITKETYPRPVKWLGVTAISTTTANIVVNQQDIIFFCVSGNIWINPAAVAVANTTAFLLIAGQSIKLNIGANLSIISDVTGGTYQYIII